MCQCTMCLCTLYLYSYTTQSYCTVCKILHDLLPPTYISNYTLIFTNGFYMSARQCNEKAPCPHALPSQLLPVLVAVTE